jgi:hypothetical protein
MVESRPLRVLIATPAAGAMVTLQYMLSFIATADGCRSRRQGKRQIDLGLYTLGHESLISRGRDHCAAISMYQKWDKLFFIDSDQGWTYDNFEKIIESDKPIIAGVTPLKTLPIALNFLPKEDDETYFKDRMRSYESLLAMREGHGQAEINVGYVGTGFMCIDVAKVLMPLSEHADAFRYPNPATGQLITHWQFFKTQPINKRCLSEDWGFLNFARKHGIEPWINADVCVTHTGALTFDARMGANVTPEQMNAIQQRALGKI